MATRTIKTRLEIAGEREYREKLKRVNAELSAQRSELKKVAEEYHENQNSQKALSERLEKLRYVIKV